MSTTLTNAPVGTWSRSALASYAAPLVVAALIAVLYFQIAIDLVDDWWTQPNLSQGLLIVPLALGIVWVRRGLTLRYPAAPDARGLMLTAFSCLVYVLGTAAAEFFLCRISLLLLVTGLLWTFWGSARTRTLSFPLLLLASAIPLPAVVYNTAAAPLQLFASDMAAGLAQNVGVSVFRDGNIIYLAHMSLGVEEACSGLNSLSAMVAGGVLLAFLLCRRNISRVLLVLAAVPIAIGANVVRVAGTAVLADYNEEFAKGFYHGFEGWLIFLIGFGALLGFAQFLASAERRLRLL